MMKNSVGISIIVLAALTGSTSFAYFYHVCVMKKVNKQTNKVQFVIGLADFHDKTHPANKVQRMYVDNSLLKKCAAVKGKLVIEDLSSVNNDGRMNCCNYAINSCEGVLGQLANKARECGIDVDNVEYRYCRVAGIGPLLSNIQASPYSFKSTTAISIAALYKEVAEEIEKIKRYDDGKMLNAIYKHTLAAVCNGLSKIAFNTAQQQSTLAHYCSGLPHKEYKQELEKLCTFDSALIDMKIMHSIIAAPQSPYTFVAAGGSHIEQMSDILKRIGYELVFATPQSACTTIKKVVNAGSPSSSESTPKPIDITVLDKFIQ